VMGKSSEQDEGRGYIKKNNATIRFPIDGGLSQYSGLEWSHPYPYWQQPDRQAYHTWHTSCNFVNNALKSLKIEHCIQKHCKKCIKYIPTW
jgi:hypothetical protein